MNRNRSRLSTIFSLEDFFFHRGFPLSISYRDKSIQLYTYCYPCKIAIKLYRSSALDLEFPKIELSNVSRINVKSYYLDVTLLVFVEP